MQLLGVTAIERASAFTFISNARVVRSRNTREHRSWSLLAAATPLLARVCEVARQSTAHEFVLVALPYAFIDEDKLPISVNGTIVRQREAAVAAVSELLNREA